MFKTSYHGYVVHHSLETFNYPKLTLAALSLHDVEAQKPVYRQLTDVSTLRSRQTMHTPNSPQKSFEWHTVKQWKQQGLCPCGNIFHSGLFWAKKFVQMGPSSLANACITALLVAAGAEACSALVSKLHVSLPSHCWLQHRLDSWYTCSIREWALVSGGWPSMHPLAFSLLTLWQHILWH